VYLLEIYLTTVIWDIKAKKLTLIVAAKVRANKRERTLTPPNYCCLPFVLGVLVWLVVGVKGLCSGETRSFLHSRLANFFACLDGKKTCKLYPRNKVHFTPSKRLARRKLLVKFSAISKFFCWKLLFSTPKNDIGAWADQWIYLQKCLCHFCKKNLCKFWTWALILVFVKLFWVLK